MRVVHRTEVWVVSGDYKLEPDPTCAPFEPVRCHTFVTESTFGLSVYRWREPRRVFDEVNRWWHDNAAAGRAGARWCWRRRRLRLPEFAAIASPDADRAFAELVERLPGAARVHLVSAAHVDPALVAEMVLAVDRNLQPMAPGGAPARRPALRDDFAAMLGRRARRGTRCVRCAHCARTAPAIQSDYARGARGRAPCLASSARDCDSFADVS